MTQPETFIKLRVYRTIRAIEMFQTFRVLHVGCRLNTKYYLGTFKLSSVNT